MNPNSITATAPTSAIPPTPGPTFIASKFNDVAIVWRRETVTPFVVSVFYEAPARGGDAVPAQESVLARAGKLAAEWIANRN